MPLNEISDKGDLFIEKTETERLEEKQTRSLKVADVFFDFSNPYK
jgi:hypothetical protein